MFETTFTLAISITLKWRLSRKLKRSDKDRFSWLRRYCSIYSLYWLINGYGERPLRALLAFLAIAALGAAIYTQGLFVYERDTESLDPPTVSVVREGPVTIPWHSAVGLSLRSLTLRSSSSYRPHSTDLLSRFVILTQNIIGPIQPGMLAIALRRRFRR